MSAGAFVRGRYSDDNTDIRPIRVQPETILATFGTTANVQPTAGIDTLPAAKVSGGRRSYGVHARYATIVFETDPPTGYKVNSPIRLPILTKVVWDGIAPGQSVSYLDKTGIVISKTPEYIR